MQANKWIEEEHRYISYKLPQGASLLETDLDKLVSCCICGKKVKYGDCYTSRHIHNDAGLGYAECENCYYGEHK
ncbi:MAG: hypothetical protein UE295_06550 [Acutalibacteraceae bacterium]|nr:hypothetical protein [Acutalibacteraceae bacterium]